MDDQRALLDMLMGKARNVPDSVKETMKETSFHDREVCTFFMCGLCPYLLFNATKSDLGRCPKSVCDNADAIELRHKYSLRNQDEKDRDGYEYGLMIYLEDLVRQCDQRIVRNKQRAEKDSAITEDVMQKISAIESQVRTLTDECCEAAEKDNIDLAQDLCRRIEMFKTEAEMLATPRDQKLTLVCEVSGNLMSSKDNEERMRAHFEGKQYLGWKLVRDKYKELKDRRLVPPNIARNRQKDQENSNSSRRDRSKDRERDRDKGDRGDRSDRERQDRDRDRDRGDRDKDRRRVRSPSRERERSRRSSSRDRDRSRRDRDRSNDRNRDRDRDRDRENIDSKRRRDKSPSRERDRADRNKDKSASITNKDEPKTRSIDRGDKDKSSSGKRTEYINTSIKNNSETVTARAPLEGVLPSSLILMSESETTAGLGILPVINELENIKSGDVEEGEELE